MITATVMRAPSPIVVVYICERCDRLWVLWGYAPWIRVGVCEVCRTEIDITEWIGGTDEPTA